MVEEPAVAWVRVDAAASRVSAGVRGSAREDEEAAEEEEGDEAAMPVMVPTGSACEADPLTPHHRCSPLPSTAAAGIPTRTPASDLIPTSPVALAPPLTTVVATDPTTQHRPCVSTVDTVVL